MTEKPESKYSNAFTLMFFGGAICGTAVLYALLAIMPDFTLDFGIWVFWFGLGVVIGAVGVVWLLVQRFVGR